MTLIEQLRQGIVTDSAEKTRAIAKALATELPAVVTLALHGDLGVGKTTFVQGLAEGLGVSERVTSPTFSIFSVHQGSHRSLVHLDAYRLENERQIESLLLEDFLVNSYCLAVEWPEKIAAWLPSDTWHLTLSIIDGDRHRITLQ
ncbi:MAG TPA: tRNA (adenosine(37)-N6)-threonylcarbamoyltransferase complex ATPase subunit type 1 TsaE [Lacunisphaera sp.]|jgi:tRNA threonylcarbamoyladenosine biosynthesis protein TsaE